MISRRRRLATLSGTMLLGALCLSLSSAFAEPLPGGTLDPTTIPKYVEPLVIPPEMPSAGVIDEDGELYRGVDPDDMDGDEITYYEIEVVQFDQQVLPKKDVYGNPLPPTTVWSYAAVGRPETRNYPAFTVEAQIDQAVRVKWVNNLVDPYTGEFLPHLLPVDQTLHWANPPQDCIDGTPRTDCRGDDPTFYTGPVPIITHVHGAHVGPESDGYPEAWYLPDAVNIPAGYATQGTLFDQFDRTNTEPGTAVFQYPNDQRAATLWYHDHTLGITRLNVYAGPAGFWLLRDPDNEDLELPGPAARAGDDPDSRYYEIPIVIQDRSFNADGSLFYPDNRAFFEGLEPDQLQIDFIPDSDVSPIWNPEAFFNTMVVNGRPWPNLDVEPRKYRLRLLNGSNSRFLILKLAANPLAPRPVTPVALPFYQIGSDGGFLEEPVMRNDLLLAPAERADVIVDFSALSPGSALYLINEGPDEPFGGGVPGTDFDPADPGTSGQVMKLTVVPLTDEDESEIPRRLARIKPLVPDNVRQVSLNEEESGQVCVIETPEGIIQQIEVPPITGDFAADCAAAGGEVFGPIAALLGTVANGEGVPRLWSGAITENPALRSTEMWEIYNFTEDAHPIHLHLVQFQIVEREVFDPAAGMPGTVYGPAPGETGLKDTVIAYPGEITRIRAKFDIAGLYVWHCHILEHEDNEMMRPYYVGAKPTP